MNYKPVIDFIRSLYPNRDIIPLHEPYFCGNEKKYLADCVDSTYVSSVGKYVDKFEEMIREFTGAKYAVATVNGTAALHVALLLAGVKRNDLVITQPLTFVATCNAISYCGAEPVFVDIDRDTLGLSPESLETWLLENTTIENDSCYFLPRMGTNEKTRMNTNENTQKNKNEKTQMNTNDKTQKNTNEKTRMNTNDKTQMNTDEMIQMNTNMVQEKKLETKHDVGAGTAEPGTTISHITQPSNSPFVPIRDLSLVPIRGKQKISACVPMHTFGHPCRIDRIVEICNHYHIPVVEDAAESIGSYYHGQHTGTFGRLGILSFNGNKSITTGGGGMIITNDDELGPLAKHITTTAKKPHPWKFEHDLVGFNYRLPNVNAALGCAQMENLKDILENKRNTAKAYQDFFSQLAEIEYVPEPTDSISNYWLNVILLKNLEEREAFLEQSNEHKVMTRPAWILMNKLEMFKKCISSDLQVSKEIADSLVNVPSSYRA